MLGATVVASGLALLDGTVVNAALPAIGRDFGAGLPSPQWVVDACLLTLGSLLAVVAALAIRGGGMRPYPASGISVTKSTRRSTAPTNSGSRSA